MAKRSRSDFDNDAEYESHVERRAKRRAERQAAADAEVEIARRVAEALAARRAETPPVQRVRLDSSPRTPIAARSAGPPVAASKACCLRCFLDFDNHDQCDKTSLRKCARCSRLKKPCLPVC
jgi:hypothetical protein